MIPPDLEETDPGETIRAIAPEELDVGTLPPITGELELGEELGRGGMGTVVAAMQMPLGRQVAVKVLKPGASENARRALLQEARTTGSLEHPNIVPIHALGRDEQSQPVLVMKRVEGRSWRSHLDEDPERKHLDRHLGVLMQVTNAIEFAHSRGYLHRDLKPDNIMIGEFGEVYVVDWGVALKIPASGTTSLVGTPNFIAPEMLESDLGAVDRRTDVFLLGGLLHFILTGRSPHRGSTIIEVLTNARCSEPPSYGERAPRALAAIARRALSREKEDRFATAAELRGALQVYLQTRTADLIAEEAERNLDELRRKLEAGAEEATLYRVFGACRFGFQQAITISPEPRALAGVREAIDLMASFELARKKPEVAAALAAELDPTPAELLNRIEAVRREVEPEAGELRRLRVLEKDSDVEMGSRARATALLLMAVGFTLLGMLLQVVTDALRIHIPFEIGLRVAMVLGVLLTVLLGRRWFVRNAASRRLGSILLAAAIALLALRSLGMIAGIETEVVLAIDLLLLGACGFVASIAIDRRLYPASALAAIASFVVAMYPRQAAAIYVVTLLVTLGLVVIAWLQRDRSTR